MKRKAKLFLAALLVAVTVFALCAPAFAASSSLSTGYVQATEAVNIRKGPGTKYERIGWLEAGAIVARVGTSGNWTQVSLGNNQYGYVSTSYLRTVTNVSSSLVGQGVVLTGTGITGSTGSTTTSGQYAATTALNVRTGPSTRYSRLGWLEKGEVVTVLSVSGNWARINWKGTECYASIKYLKAVSGTTGGTVSGTVYYVTNAAVTAYYGPGTTFARAGVLARGAVLDRLGAIGSWTMITWGSGVAYIPTSYVSTSTTGGTSSGVTVAGTYVTTENVTTYRGPGTSYATAGTLLRGVSVQVITASGGWAMLNFNGTALYVPSTSLRLVSASSTGGNWTDDGYWTGSGSSGDRWTSTFSSPDSTLLSFVSANKNNTSYNFSGIRTIYTANAPAGYSFRSNDFYFSGTNALTVTFTSDTAVGNVYPTARFIWYRNRYACPDNFSLWSSFQSSGTTYYFREFSSANYSEAYWYRYGELFYARVPYSFTRTQAATFFQTVHAVSLSESIWS